MARGSDTKHCHVLLISSCEASTQVVRAACSKLHTQLHRAQTLDEVRQVLESHSLRMAFYDFDAHPNGSPKPADVLRLGHGRCPWSVIAQPSDKRRASRLLRSAASFCLYKPLVAKEVRHTLELGAELDHLRQRERELAAKLKAQMKATELVGRNENALVLNLDRFVETMSSLDSGNAYETFVHHVERQLLQAVLQETAGNQTRAARILGINRNTLHKKIKDLHLAVKS